MNLILMEQSGLLSMMIHTLGKCNKLNFQCTTIHDFSSSLRHLFSQRNIANEISLFAVKEIKIYAVRE